MERLRAAGDFSGERLLQRIVDDQIRYVGFDIKHFIAMAKMRGGSTESLWKVLVKRYYRGTLKTSIQRLGAPCSRSIAEFQR